MLVKNYMTRHPIMIEPTKRIFEAQKIMVENNIRHLPVAGDGKRLLGLITRQRMQVAPEKLASLEVWEITRYLADLTVEKVMVKARDVIVATPEDTLEEAAALIIRHKVGGVVVVEDNMVVGVLTETDLLIELQNLLGANEPGWRVTVRIPDKTGEVSKLTGALAERGWGIMSWGSGRAPKASDYWDIVLKVRNCKKEELEAVLKTIDTQEIIDIREAKVYT